MKKILILSVLVVLSLVAVLYATQDRFDEKEAVSIEEVYRAQFSYQMPDVMMEPVIGFTLN